jgi:hypothetical protein
LCKLFEKNLATLKHLFYTIIPIIPCGGAGYACDGGGYACDGGGYDD